MRVHSRKLFMAACTLAAAALTGVPAHAATAPAGQGAATSAPAPLRATTGEICGPPYVKGDRLLGPVFLPREGLIATILDGYVRYGGLSPERFLERYYDYTTQFYRFPQDFGFAHSGGFTNGRPLVRPVRLPLGYKVDRFGGEPTGAFLAPFGTPFSKRSLPPSNLNNAPGDPHLCNYHAYRVTRPFYVDGGPAASAFQMRGLGEQFHTLAKYIPGAPTFGTNGEVSIQWLADNGYLERLN
ncbi:TNT domain-containing protein [Microbispora sp. CA-135349]|uniref:TNT domain-containing protein n=1 Tax=Microbispora sp. CA-135349 TaxID=3239953 RepID=UPI003D8DB222